MGFQIKRPWVQAKLREDITKVGIWQEWLGIVEVQVKAQDILAIL